MSARGSAVAANWDDVWAEYDARQPAPPAPEPVRRAAPQSEFAAPAPSLEADGADRAGPARSRSRWPVLALLPMLALGWVGAPYATAWSLIHALDGRDGAEMSRHLDLPALQSAMRDSLVPHAAAGDRTPEARAFLTGMAEEISAAWANPKALAEVARARGVPPGAAAQALRGTVPTGLTRFEVALQGSVAPMALQIELTGATLTPRWQVTGVRLEERQPVPPAPPMRLSGLR